MPSGEMLNVESSVVNTSNTIEHLEVKPPNALDFFLYIVLA